MRFIDLFAGLGGFHIALRKLGHDCVFASELDSELRNLYEKNFGLKCEGDIRDIDTTTIPSHDILCAGFPCQPFSKAGRQLGSKCPQWGDLFQHHVLRIIKFHKPKFIMLENVANLERHNDGKTWSRMKGQLKRCGYDVDSKILSPHRFGIPQIRERIFIVGSRSGLSRFQWPSETNEDVSIHSILECNPKNVNPISDRIVSCLEVWQEFLDRSPRSEELPSFPIWTMEFGATYPYEDTTPFTIGSRKLRKYFGSHGVKLADVKPKDRFNYLPSYARSPVGRFPGWKVQFIRQNRAFYESNRKWIDPWLPKVLEFPPTWQKLEWNCKGEERDIWRYIVQFRASGVRVKRPTTAPSLIAMTATQVPIIASERRYMTPVECKRLQNMEVLQHLPNSSTKLYKAFGNTVNVKIVELIGQALIGKNSNKRLSAKKYSLDSTELKAEFHNNLVLVTVDLKTCLSG